MNQNQLDPTSFLVGVQYRTSMKSVQHSWVNNFKTDKCNLPPCIHSHNFMQAVYINIKHVTAIHTNHFFMRLDSNSQVVEKPEVCRSEHMIIARNRSHLIVQSDAVMLRLWGLLKQQYCTNLLWHPKFNQCQVI